MHRLAHEAHQPMPDQADPRTQPQLDGLVEEGVRERDDRVSDRVGLAPMCLDQSHLKCIAAQEREARKEADANARAARKNEELFREQVYRLCVARGLREAEEGNPFAALLWFAEPLAHAGPLIAEENRFQLLPRHLRQC